MPDKGLSLVSPQFSVNHLGRFRVVGLWYFAVFMVLTFLQSRVVLAQCVPVLTIQDPVPQAGDTFGRSVAAANGLVLIGAPGEDYPGHGFVGRAHLHDLATGVSVRIFDHPSPYSTDSFGNAVAMTSDKILVGAPHRVRSPDFGSGVAYLLDLNTGALLQTFSNPGTAFASFGSAVAIEGDTVFIGAPGDAAAAGNSGLVYQFDAATGAAVRTIPNPNPVLNSHFGCSIALSASHLVVGAHGFLFSSTIAGRAYCFDPSDGTLIHTLMNPNPTVRDTFGSSVALSGQTVVVGSHRDDTSFTDSGRAFVFDAVTGGLVHTLLNPSPAANDWFGFAVAVSGNHVAVSAERDDTLATDAGQAYLFDAVTGALARSFPNPAPATDDRIGTSLAILGNRIVVAAEADDTTMTDVGLVHVFEADCVPPTPTPTPTASPTATPTPSPTPSPTASPTPTPSATPTPSPTPTLTPIPTPPFTDCSEVGLLVTIPNPAAGVNDQFGFIVSASDGRILVGAPLDNPGGIADSGSAYIYDAATGNLLHTLSDPTPHSGKWFGWDVDLEGNLAVVGAARESSSVSRAGKVYLFDSLSGALLRTIDHPEPQSGDEFGEDVATDGTYIFVGAQYRRSGSPITGDPAVGRAYLFDAATGAHLHTFINPQPTAADFFGSTGEVRDGLVWIGAYGDDALASNAGRAYLYDATTGALLRTFNNPDPDPDDNFGLGMSIYGGRLVGGVQNDDNAGPNSGSIYLFDPITGAVTHFFLNPSGTLGGLFGRRSEVEESLIAVGAALDDISATNSGSVHVFDLAVNQLVQSIHSPVASADNFGNSVAMDQSRIVVGAHLNDTGATDSGRVYVYACIGPTPSPTPSPTATPSPSPTASPSPTETPTPSASPTPNSVRNWWRYE